MLNCKLPASSRISALVSMALIASSVCANGASASVVTAVSGVTGGAPGMPVSTGSFGFDFTVGSSPITVNSLGYYAPYEPSGSSNQVAIYTAPINGTATQVGATDTILSTSTTSTPGWNYLALGTPITLAANTTYNILGCDVSGTGTASSLTYLVNATGTVTYGNDLTYNIMVYGNYNGTGTAAVVAPTATFLENDPGAFSPNFQYSVVPEPATLAVIAIPAAMALLRRRRKLI